MRRRYIAFWSVGTALLVVFVVWLVASVLRNTALDVDLEARSATAETTVGELVCRKTLSGRFPFLTVTCEEER